MRLRDEDIGKVKNKIIEATMTTSCTEKFGLVAVIDVLGWKNRSKIDDRIIEKLIIVCNRFRAWAADLSIRVGSDISLVNLSDTIVILAERSSVFNAITNIRELIGNALAQDIMLRGAISWGTYKINKDKNIFTGEAIYAAHALSEKIDWAGVVFTKEFEKAILEKNDYAELEVELGVINYNVPLKMDKEFKRDNSLSMMLTLLPIFFNTNEMNNNEQKISFMKNKYLKLMSEEKIKLKNTLDYLQAIKNTVATI